MIYMQDEDPDGWCIYDGDERIFSGLEEDTACIVVSKMNALRAEVARLQAELDEHRSALTLIRDMPPDAPQPLERCKGYARATLKKWSEPYMNETTTG